MLSSLISRNGRVEAERKMEREIPSHPTQRGKRRVALEKVAVKMTRLMKLVATGRVGMMTRQMRRQTMEFSKEGVR